MEMMKKYCSYVNGEWLPDGKVLASINPSTGGQFAELACGTRETVDAAVEAAKAAFAGFKKTKRVERAALLRKMADRMEENIDFLAEAECIDTGKTIGEAHLHMTFCIDTFRYFAAAIEAKEEIAISHDSGTISYVTREPLGVIGIIVAWNCPPMLLSWKLAPALAMGNTVVIKPSVHAAAGVCEMIRIWADLFEPGVVNIILGESSEIGDYLQNHKGLNKLSFTGSTEVGRKIGAAAGNNLIPVTLELGGKSATVVFDDCDFERVIQKTCIGILSSAGEVCVGNSRAIVQDTIYDKFVERIKNIFSNAVVGDAMDPKSQVGPVITEKHMNRVLSYIESGKEQGATLLAGGYRVTEDGCDKGYFVAPTLFGDVKHGMKIEQEEIFGPVLCVSKFHTEEEALELANGTDYGLGAAVWTSDYFRAMKFGKELEAGIVWINDYLDTGVGQPFGGVKNSGIGREVNKVALDHYSQVKNLCIVTDRSIPPVW